MARSAAEHIGGVQRSPKSGPTVFVSAAEPSADRHGAELIRALRTIRPEARLVGICGPKMAAEGCECLFDMSGDAAMLLGVLGAAGRGARVLSIAERYLRMNPVAACVVIDSPVLHLRMARQAHAANIPVLYYIAPQLWAWGANRIYALRHSVERVAAILPFEEAYFRDQGVEAEYVGHPLVEQLQRESLDHGVRENLRELGSPRVAILPGSRRHVVAEVLPGQIEVAEAIAKRFPNAVFGVSVAHDGVAGTIESVLRRASVMVQRVPRHHAELIESADLVLVASGTTALEVALRRKPMIVMYNASRVFYHLVARWMLRTPHLSLPNILAGRRIVPEFMPYYTSTGPIAQNALELLEDQAIRETMVAGFDEIARLLGPRHASKGAAELLTRMIDRGGH